MSAAPLVLRLAADADSAEVDQVAHRAITELAGGGSVVLPTDTVYGVAAHPERPGAVDRLFALKGRDHSKALAVLVADETQAGQWLDLSGLDPEAAEAATTLMQRAWPGGLTVVGPRAPRWRRIDLGGNAATIGVRVPDAAVVRAIAARVGPIVVTSANRSGSPTPTDAAAASAELSGDIGLVVDTGPCGGLASTVVDVTSVPFVVVRPGPVDPRDLGVDAAGFKDAGSPPVGVDHG